MVLVIKDIQKNYPKIKLETSIMVGFPSEIDQDFMESVNLLDNIAFDRIDVYIYNERPNLPSIRIPNTVPEQTKKQKIQSNQISVHNRQDEKAAEKYVIGHTY